MAPSAAHPLARTALDYSRLPAPAQLPAAASVQPSGSGSGGGASRAVSKKEKESLDDVCAASSASNALGPSHATLDPPGYVAAATSRKSAPKPRAAPTPESIAALKAKKAWDVAFGPAKNLPMNAFMLYMSGAGVQIFSMMVVGMLLTNPIKAALGVQGAFAPLSTPSQPHALLPQKLAFLGAQALCFALGVWKCAGMGLLPTASSDWLAWRAPRLPLEFSPLYS